MAELTRSNRSSRTGVSGRGKGHEGRVFWFPSSVDGPRRVCNSNRRSPSTRRFGPVPTCGRRRRSWSPPRRTWYFAPDGHAGPAKHSNPVTAEGRDPAVVVRADRHRRHRPPRHPDERLVVGRNSPWGRTGRQTQRAAGRHRHPAGQIVAAVQAGGFEGFRQDRHAGWQSRQPPRDGKHHTLDIAKGRFSLHPGPGAVGAEAALDGSKWCAPAWPPATWDGPA